MKKEEIVAESTAVDEAASLEPPGKPLPVNPEVHSLKRTPSIPPLTISQKSADFMNRFFPSATFKDWTNWQWQVRNSYTSFAQLARIMELTPDEAESHSGDQHLPVRITPYYASLIFRSLPSDPIRRTMVPVVQELIQSPGEAEDPLSEENTSPVPNLIHRYPDRVLFFTTGFCAAYCRYCTRSHKVAKKDRFQPGTREWEVALTYIREHTEIRDVILSGGDPLTLSDQRIEFLLSALRSIPHVEIIRIGTKVPVVLPQRITPALTRMLKKYHPLFMSIHFTHPGEMTPEVQQACNRLADAGIPLGSQTVLLKGINDNAETFTRLVHELLKVRVRPYYLYQCDPIPGSAHFRTPVEKGLELIRALRGHTSGYAIPHYVIDAPGGGGKIPLLPDYVEGRDHEGNLLLRNFRGKLYSYPDYL